MLARRTMRAPTPPSPPARRTAACRRCSEKCVSHRIVSGHWPKAPAASPPSIRTLSRAPSIASPRRTAASVALVVELDGSKLQFAPQPNALFADALELSFFALSDEGHALRGTRKALNLAIRPETYQRVKALGIRLNSRTTLAPGRYELRSGARDPNTNTSGTV